MKLDFKPNKKIYTRDEFNKMKEFGNKTFPNLFIMNYHSIKVDLDVLHTLFYSKLNKKLFIEKCKYIVDYTYINIDGRYNDTLSINLIDKHGSDKLVTNVYEENLFAYLLQKILKLTNYNINEIIQIDMLDNISFKIESALNKRITELYRSDETKQIKPIMLYRHHVNSHIRHYKNDKVEKFSIEYKLLNTQNDYYYYGSNEVENFHIMMEVNKNIDKTEEISEPRITVIMVEPKLLALNIVNLIVFTVEDFIEYLVDKLTMNTRLLNRYSLTLNK